LNFGRQSVKGEIPSLREDGTPKGCNRLSELVRRRPNGKGDAFVPALNVKRGVLANSETAENRPSNEVPWA